MAADAPETTNGPQAAQLAPAEAFSEAERAAIYRVIHSRRDVRDEFLPDDVPRDVLLRILDAAHHAPSVGFMQPWNFIIVRDIEKRRAAHDAFLRACEAEEQALEPERRSLYRSLKLQGILKAPLNICVTCDRARFGATGLGRSQQPDTDILSTACAVQNLWLAARAEGVGVGWVSIVQAADLRHIFNIPNEIAIIAYLCVGYVAKAYTSPELEVKRWASRLPLENLIFEDSWGQLAASTNPP
ncbi:MAG: 5,6-dimethylbenzimidazole synthase [Alphaproteobacteria bacterium]|nr:5,6-dimethylbenzimidazole synthase [Alphaproteobacteria bacterium]